MKKIIGIIAIILTSTFALKTLNFSFDKVKEISVIFKNGVNNFFEAKLETAQKTIKKEVKKEKKAALKPSKPNRKKMKRQKHQQESRRCLCSKKKT